MKSIGTVDSPSNPMESAAAGVIGRGQAAPVELDPGQWIGRGWKRECYLHPIDPGLCIKVASDIPVGTPGWRERVVSLCRKGSVGDAHNRREWKAYCAFGTILAPFVPRYHGFIATSRGQGLVVDLVRDGDGAPSSQLRGWLHQASADRGAALFDRFRVHFDFLAAHDLWLMDLNLQNFLVQVAADGTERPWLIDLKRLS
ncbi:MAG: YrbL family protein, partial [Alphaproteobacteria bacterium]